MKTIMRKCIFCCIVMMTILLTSCGNSTAQKIVDAYEDATSQMDEASDDDECVQIHSDLMDNLCDIVEADPEFLEKAEKGDLSKSDIKQIEAAYKKYTNKLQEKVSSDRYAFMPFASLKNIKNKIKKENQSDRTSFDDDTDDNLDSDDDLEEDNLDSDDDSDGDEMSSTSSEDWDELLESYEEYVDKYISYLKKASKGDMDALSEYPALLEKAQEFNEKMQNAQGVMSSSQWSRYIKITNKMTKAAQEMSN